VPSTALQRAARHIFALGVPDLATELCQTAMAVGLAKLHHAQVQLGLPADALFIGGPDMTVTRNLARWESGFAYGGKLDWTGPEPLIVVQVKPNVCGMLVAGVRELPPVPVLEQRLERLRREPGALDGVPLEFDLDRSNHFAALYTPPPEAPLPPHILVLHGAAPELRADKRFGWGLYWDRSPALLAAARHFDTPWGPLDVLLGEAAETYWQLHQRAAAFAAERRLLFAQALLGEVEVLTNDLHQGLRTPGEMYLGCHPLPPAGTLLPFMVDRGAPAYLVRGRPNLTPQHLHTLGWQDHAEALGVRDRLLTANLVPHGAGYAVAGPGEVRLVEMEGRTAVRLRRGGQETGNPREMITGYRGEEVLQRLVELDLGEVAYRLDFEYEIVAP